MYIQNSYQVNIRITYTNILLLLESPLLKIPLHIGYRITKNITSSVQNIKATCIFKLSTEYIFARITYLNKRQRKPKGQSRMNNPGTMEILGTQATARTKTKKAKKRNAIEKAKKMSNLTKNVGESRCSRKISHRLSFSDVSIIY